jgi:CheY-like chemotaxis protein
MIYGFAKQSHGHVRIYSEVGHGTTVRLYLPRAKTAAAAADAEGSVAEEPPPADVTILVVEDNAEVRLVATTMLASLGYRVIEAEDAASALEVLRQDQPIHLLFTDIVMPGGKTGFELAREAKAMRPDLKVLFTSGFSEASLRAAGPDSENVSRLSKPYRKVDLARIVRDVLSANGR